MAVQTNTKVAQKIGIEPVMDLEDIRALLLDFPAVNPIRADETYKENIIAGYIIFVLNQRGSDHQIFWIIISYHLVTD